MTEISLPFNSVDHDRVYDAEVIAKKDSYFIPDGINAQGGALAATADGTNMNVTIAEGMAYIQGHFYNNTAPKIMTHATADPNYDRIDRIVARLDKNQGTRAINIVIKQGTPASSPVEPSLQRDAYIVEIPIARVLITKALSTISQAKVTDERGTLLDPIQYWAQIATINSLLATKVDSSIFGSWIPISLFGGATGSAYYKIDNLPGGRSKVSLIIYISMANTLNTDVIFATLPSGARPAGNLAFPANMSGACPIQILINSTGSLMIQNRYTTNWSVGNYVNGHYDFYTGG
jgi:hypothetical protein